MPSSQEESPQPLLMARTTSRLFLFLGLLHLTTLGKWGTSMEQPQGIFAIC